ncbi:replication protein [Acinetobacter qingfengensis]|uniref:Replication protein n=2 Tax=Acinetobacter qingfengensis TaxID=1262585 RepID=A0A1E7RD34_9GAMM|nr:replication protein [Acinetobacter qingfengensis]
MGVTAVDTQSAAYDFPRKLDNVQLIKTEKGTLPVIHAVSCDDLQIAAVDWVTFAFGVETLGNQYLHISPEYEHDGLTYAIETTLDQWLFEIFGFGLGKKRDRGMHFYKFAYELQDGMGMVLYGHNSKSIAVQINGTGCALARKGWESRLYQYLNNEFQRAKISRIDLAHDDFEGQYITVDLANAWDDNDGFWCGGRSPNIEHKGNWKRINGKGRTLCVGNRDSGKYCRIYERGKKEGDQLSLWTRAEVEFKACDRHIPFDVLLSPSQYFVGAYPCFEWLAKILKQEFVNPEKIKTIKKQSQINLDKAIEITKHQFGKYIKFFRKIFNDDQVIEMISASNDDVPQRLNFSMTAAMQYVRNNEIIKPALCQEFPLFTGVHGVNQTMLGA